MGSFYSEPRSKSEIVTCTMRWQVREQMKEQGGEERRAVQAERKRDEGRREQVSE